MIPLVRIYAWTNIVSGDRILIDSSTIRVQYFVLREGQPSIFVPIPFTSRPAAAVMHNGAVITDGASPEIKEYDLAGRLRRIVRIDGPQRRVSDADVRHYADVTGTRIYGDMPIPKTMPTFQSLLVDDEGWLWAQLYGWDPAQEVVWVVFDPDLRPHGSITTPVGLDIHQVGSDFILGVSTDDLGVQRVQRYQLDRQPDKR